MGDLIVHCSFCGKRADDIQKLFTEPSVAICNECISLCTDELKEKGVVKKEQPRCSFCGKLETGQRKLIIGPSTCICNACTATCAERFQEENKKELNRARARIKQLEEMIRQKQGN